LKAFAAARPVSCPGRARLDGFAYDVEILFLARRLGLAVTEVPVQAEVRAGSKVQLAVDALAMGYECLDGVLVIDR
jgi:hypothetical protein